MQISQVVSNSNTIQFHDSRSAWLVVHGYVRGLPITLSNDKLCLMPIAFFSLLCRLSGKLWFHASYYHPESVLLVPLYSFECCTCLILLKVTHYCTHYDCTQCNPSICAGLILYGQRLVTAYILKLTLSKLWDWGSNLCQRSIFLYAKLSHIKR